MNDSRASVNVNGIIFISPADIAATSPLRRTGRRARGGHLGVELAAVKAEERETAESTMQESRTKMLIKSKFILKKHFGNATVVDGSKIRIDFDSPSEYALVSVPSFVKNNEIIIAYYFIIFYFILLYIGN